MGGVIYPGYQVLCKSKLVRYKIMPQCHKYIKYEVYIKMFFSQTVNRKMDEQIAVA